jgi:hypothetical protein
MTPKIQLYMYDTGKCGTYPVPEISLEKPESCCVFQRTGVV